MWRIKGLWFSIKRVTWYKLLCFIHGHDIQDLDTEYPNLGSMCFRCFEDGDNIKYEYGLVYWLNMAYAKYVKWSLDTGRVEFLWPIEERFEGWFHRNFPNSGLKSWIYKWWEY